MTSNTSTWQRYLPSKDAVWIAATLLLGNGAVWGFLQFRLAHGQRIAELRTQREEVFHQITDLESHFRHLLACNPNRTDLDAEDDRIISEHRLSLLQDDLVATEKALAKLEGQAPRDVQLQFARPGAPTNLEVRELLPEGSSALVAKSDSAKHPDCGRS